MAESLRIRKYSSLTASGGYPSVNGPFADMQSRVTGFYTG
jgi:hypothetical protein